MIASVKQILHNANLFIWQISRDLEKFQGILISFDGFGEASRDLRSFEEFGDVLRDFVKFCLLFFFLSLAHTERHFCDFATLRTESH